jgi:hypothetical protein
MGEQLRKLNRSILSKSGRRIRENVKENEFMK